ncbi:hypothetical protein MHI22_05405 [Lysinibacillus sp. FSL L8-0312]|uniref:hypothetical protein n=1 Tax=Lysinibacillus sp. FSL L8-0312 TaxID=2921521 RepID=UPI0030FBD17B
MDQKQFNAIKERVAKATSGPWYSSPDGTVYLKHTQDVADVWTDNKELDAAFIANARDDVPALVAEVERLRALIKELACDTAENTAVFLRKVSGNE